VEPSRDVTGKQLRATSGCKRTVQMFVDEVQSEVTREEVREEEEIKYIY
jgi:hypothetical protein